MDPTLVSEPGGIVGWISTYGNVIYFFAQILYWLLIVVFLGYAVAQFKRWVNYQLGTGASGKLKSEQTAEKDVPVAEFVE